MRFSARLLLRFFLPLLLLFLFVTPRTHQVFAQTSIDPRAPNTEANVPQNLHFYTQNVMIEVMAALSCQIAGIDPTNPKAQCLGADPQTGKIGFVNGGGGAIGATGSLIGEMMTPPVKVGQYTDYLASNFGVSHADAATSNTAPGARGCDTRTDGPNGTGWCALQPLLNLWTVFRNIVYLFFTIVFLFIGVAIMMRVKIDPRTVMSIQNTIPQIIIGLILITFSFAIASFMVDLMYSFMYVAVNIIEPADPQMAAGTGYAITASTSPLEGASHIGSPLTMASGPAGNIGDSLRPFFNNPPGHIIAGLIGAYIGQKAGNAIGGLVKSASTVGTIIGALFGTAGDAVVGPEGTILGAFLGQSIGQFIGSVTGAVVGGVTAGFFADNILAFVSKIIIYLILTIALLWALLRVWFVLLTSYIFVLFDVILGPFWILAGILPGGRAGISGWLRDLSSHLAVFPATVIMFLLGRVFVDAFANPHAAGVFVAPMIGAFSPATLGSIIGMGIIFSTPEVLTLTRNLFKAPKVELGGGFGKAIGTGTAVIGAGAGATWGQLWKPADYYHRAGPVRGWLASRLGVATQAEAARGNKFVRAIKGGFYRWTGGREAFMDRGIKRDVSTK